MNNKIILFTCNILRGSLSATGIETWERSLPMFLHKRFHKDNPSVSGFGHGSLVRRPVIFLISPDPPQSTIRNYNNNYFHNNKHLN